MPLMISITNGYSIPILIKTYQREIVCRWKLTQGPLSQRVHFVWNSDSAFFIRILYYNQTKQKPMKRHTKLAQSVQISKTVVMLLTWLGLCLFVLCYYVIWNQHIILQFKQRILYFFQAFFSSVTYFFKEAFCVKLWP